MCAQLGGTQARVSVALTPPHVAECDGHSPTIPLNTIPLPTVLVSADGTIGAANDAFVALTGTFAHICRGIGTALSDYIHPDDQTVIECAIARPDHTPHTRTIRVIDAEQRTTSCTLTISQHDGSAEAQKICFLIPTTSVETARLERELEQRTRELQQFVASISHDVRGACTTVSGFSSLLADKLANQTDPDVRDYLSFITDGAARMQAMLHSLLGYSRITTHGRPFERVETALLALDESHVLTSLPQHQGAQVTIHDLPVVMGDSEQLRNVFRQLFTNALTYRSTQPAQVDVSAHQSDHMWIFTIRDNGVGMRESDCERVFAPFTRLNSREEFDGLGMGLTMCRRIVERHGGTIALSSKKNQGSVVTFSLPAADAWRHEDRVS